MLNQNKLNASQPVVLLGECHPLLEQLGTADGLFTLGEAAGALKLPRIENAASLARFLDAYLSQVLLSLDLPAICLAHECASRNESRELVTLDMEIAGHHGHRDFASASRRVGQNQLRRLRPLRDVRVVQRYLQAVETGHAQGWHTVVFGLTLAVYSLPVRQGLLGFAQQTMKGFIQAAARPLALSAADCTALLESRCTGWPEKLDAIVAKTSNGGLD